MSEVEHLFNRSRVRALKYLSIAIFLLSGWWFSYTFSVALSVAGELALCCEVSCEVPCLSLVFVHRCLALVL